MTTETEIASNDYAQAIFDRVVAEIEASSEARDDAGFLQYVRENGFTTTNLSKGPILRLAHEVIFANGYSVLVEYRSYDPSGPFQNEPDINKFEAKLFYKGELLKEQYEQYSDKF